LKCLSGPAEALTGGCRILDLLRQQSALLLPESYQIRFLPSVSTNGTVNAILIQPDGKIMLGGSFTASGGLPRTEMARFVGLTPVTQVVTVSGDQSTMTWTRGGSAPSFQAVKFEETTDGTHWLTVGQAVTTDGLTWSLTGVAPSGSSQLLVRATGVVPTSQFSSSGLVQTVYYADTGGLPVVNSPAAATGAPGVAFSFTVTATQSPQSFSATGLPPGLGMNTVTGVISGTPTTDGSYTVAITVTNTVGSATSYLTILISTPSGSTSPISTTSSADRLINISSRADLSGGQNLIAGFVVAGTGSKTLLLRAAGPSLAQFGVVGFMAAPELDLYSASGSVISMNTGWNSSLASTFSQVGAFPFSANSDDVAVVISLAPGNYTLHVYDPLGVGGIVLTEVYDADPSPLTSPTRLTNISARGPISSGAGALIGGFVVAGNTVKSVLIRGVGPGLAAYGVTDAIPDPELSVYDANGNLVAQNLNWTNQTVTGADQASVTSADITSTDASVGAFALSAQSADTALIANLPPGAYTFEVISVSNATGEALGEVYELP